MVIPTHTYLTDFASSDYATGLPRIDPLSFLGEWGLVIGVCVGGGGKWFAELQNGQRAQLLVGGSIVGLRVIVETELLCHD